MSIGFNTIYTNGVFTINKTGTSYKTNFIHTYYSDKTKFTKDFEVEETYFIKVN